MMGGSLRPVHPLGFISVLRAIEPPKVRQPVMAKSLSQTCPNFIYGTDVEKAAPLIGVILCSPNPHSSIFHTH